MKLQFPGIPIKFFIVLLMQ